MRNFVVCICILFAVSACAEKSAIDLGVGVFYANNDSYIGDEKITAGLDVTGSTTSYPLHYSGEIISAGLGIGLDLGWLRESFDRDAFEDYDIVRGFNSIYAGLRPTVHLRIAVLDVYFGIGGKVFSSSHTTTKTYNYKYDENGDPIKESETHDSDSGSAYYATGGVMFYIEGLTLGYRMSKMLDTAGDGNMQATTHVVTIGIAKF